MDRIQFIEHKGIRILMEDYSRLTPGSEFDAALEAAARIIRTQPTNSVLAVVDVSGVSFNQEILGKMKQFVSDNTPYIKSSAVVGITGLLEIALSAVIKFTGRSNIKMFDNIQSAKDWLITL